MSSVNTIKTFQIDSLIGSLNGIQQEKHSLENQLQEVRKKRRDLEKSLETVESKLKQTNEVYRKMTETLKVAQHKVSHSQQQINSMEAENSLKRLSVNSLNEEMRKCKENGLNETKFFQNELSGLANKFFSARNNYTDEALHNKIKSTLTKNCFLDNKNKNVSVDAQGIENTLNDFKLSGASPFDDNVIDLATRKQILLEAEEEHSVAKVRLEQLQKDVAC